MKQDYAKYLLNKSRRDYNLIAGEFSNTRQLPWPEIKFLFDDSSGRVLDLGCGNGRFYPFFKGHYIGVDNSEKLIELAKIRFPEADFRTADALNLPFEDNSFDRIYSIAVLHHIPSKELRLKFLKEAKRVLKPNGRLILTVWKRKDFLFKFTLLNLFKLDFRDVLEPWGKKVLRYYHCFSKRELKKLVEKAGFEIKDIGIVQNEKGNRRNIYVVGGK